MNIGLVIPPSPFLADAKVFVSLGILQVAERLRQLEHHVEVLDLLDRPTDYESATEAFANKGFDWIGITATTPEFHLAVKILASIKKAAPTTRTLIGGPHATQQPESCVAAGFDRVVCDDGISGTPSALKALSQQVVVGPQVAPMDWPYPAYDLLDLSSYHYDLHGRGIKSLNALWSMGCSFGCSHCSGRSLDYYRKVRVMPPEKVVAELDRLHSDHGYVGFMAFDDEVNIKKDWFAALCAALSTRSYKWRAFVKANLFTREQAKLMADAGCVEVCTGVESGSDRILKDVIRKQTTYQINKDFVTFAREAGMTAKGFCMIGLPSETIEDVEMTKRWILDAKPDGFDITIFTPFPGSPIFEWKYPAAGRRDKDIKPYTPSVHEIEFESMDFAKDGIAYKTVPGEYRSAVSTPTLSREDLVRLRDEIDRDCRAALGLAEIKRGNSATEYHTDAFDHSMGQSGCGPGSGTK